MDSPTPLTSIDQSNKSTHSSQASPENPTLSSLPNFQQLGMPKASAPVMEGHMFNQTSRQAQNQPWQALIMGQTIYSIMVAFLFPNTTSK